jgi:hypothetical protein
MGQDAADRLIDDGAEPLALGADIDEIHRGLPQMLVHDAFNS